MSALALVAAVLVEAARAQAGFGALVPAGGAVTAGHEPALAGLAPGRMLLAAARIEDGVSHVRLWGRAGGGEWTPELGGLPVDATGRDCRRPVLSADGAGHAVLLYARFDDGAWRQHAAFFDGANLSPLNGGAAIDTAAAGNAWEAAAAFVTVHTLILAVAQVEGGRAALHLRLMADGVWGELNGGAPVDDAAGGWSEAPVVAADGRGGAMIGWVQGGRLELLRVDATGLTRLAEVPARPDLGAVANPRLCWRADGSLLAAWRQTTPSGAARVLAASWDGYAWTAVNGGAPLDDAPAGAGALAIAAAEGAAATLVWAAEDQLDTGAPVRLQALRVTGAAAAPIVPDADLKAGPAGVVGGLQLAVDPAAGGSTCLVFVQDDATIYCRAGESAAAAAAPAAAAARPGVRVEHAAFRPGLGQSATVRVETGGGSLRVGLYTLAGSPVRRLADGPAAGEVRLDWDGRNDLGEAVAAGAYLLVTRGDDVRDTRTLVVIR